MDRSLEKSDQCNRKRQEEGLLLGDVDATRESAISERVPLNLAASAVCRVLYQFCAVFVVGLSVCAVWGNALRSQARLFKCW
jgi:hypothetical protein